MTMRFSTIAWMLLWVVAAFGLYMVKYKVQALRVEVAATERQLREEEKNLHVLVAEWAYLNRPERLRHLSEKYLSLQSMRGQQIADFSAIPYVLQSPVQQASGEEDVPAAAHATLASGAAYGR